MRSALSLGLAIFILGATFGAAGLNLWSDYQREQSNRRLASTAAGVMSLDGKESSQRSVSIAEQGLVLTIRATDSLIRLTTEDGRTLGVRVYDTYSNSNPQTASGVDLVWERREENFDQPEAASLDDYREPLVEGLSIQETRDLRIDGRPAIKQLYTATVSVPGPFGSTQQRPIAGLLRYVILDGDRILIVRAPGDRQTFLDAVAQGLRFGSTAIGKADLMSLEVDLGQGVEAVEGVDQTGTAGDALQVVPSEDSLSFEE